MADETEIAVPASPSERLREIFLAFGLLGLTAFGGPIAHLGYFREAFVQRRRWLTEEAYGDLVALCQFLPGPASSQVGFAIGLLRGGLPGALAAWTAFTLPSALALVLFAYGAFALDGPVGDGLIHGLRIVAVAVVAQAVAGMAERLAAGRIKAAIAIAAVAVVALLPSFLGQIAAILGGGLFGLLACRDEDASGNQARFAVPFGRRAALSCLALAIVPLVALPILAGAAGQPLTGFLEGIYTSGTLVFGGGHVVLPLLQASVVAPGYVSADAFLAGYGAAQAVPGPLFTFAAYLGAVFGGLGVAILALIAVFLPGLLLLAAALPFWERLRARSQARAVLAGTNAAVVGILGAALYDPVFVSAVRDLGDFALALAGFAALTRFGQPPWRVVVALAAGGLLVA